MPAIVPPDEGSYSYAGTGYANPHTVTQIANGVSTSTYSYDLGDHVYYMLNREAGRLVDVDKVLSTRKDEIYLHQDALGGAWYMQAAPADQTAPLQVKLSLECGNVRFLLATNKSRHEISR